MDLAEFRRQKDEFFRRAESPLTPDQRTGFSGLKYWPENPALRLRLPLKTDVSHDFIMMPTSTGGQQRFTREGKIEFVAAGQPASLFIYQDVNGEYFLPFRDGTSGQESYAAGRYLEPEFKDGKLEVDFNLAYNPYCAYNEHFSCPLPPAENWIKARIEAGEKKFHD